MSTFKMVDIFPANERTQCLSIRSYDTICQNFITTLYEKDSALHAEREVKSFSAMITQTDRREPSALWFYAIG